MKTIVEKLREYLDYKGIYVSLAEKDINVSNGTLSKPFNAKTTIKTDTLEKFLKKYNDISADWLLFDRGTMLREGIPPEINGYSTNEVVKALKAMAKDVVRLEIELDELKKRQSNFDLQRVAEERPNAPKLKE